VSDRLTSLDVSFLYLEEPTTAMHTGSVMIFSDPGDGLAFERLLQHVEARIAHVPRYRQRLRWIPGRLGNPVWVDDEKFDITYHVRRSAVPRPGSEEQLCELVARLQSRRLDRNRPLWELIFVEGLEQDRFAVVTKVHQAMVDGIHAVHLAQVVLDAAPSELEMPYGMWRPAPEPSMVELVAGALADSVRRPRDAAETVRAGFGDLQVTAGHVIETMGGIARTVVHVTRAPASPLNQEISEHRRYAMVSTDLQDYRRVRNAFIGRNWAQRRARSEATTGPLPPPVPTMIGIHGTTTTVNDVVLATLSGALRAWLLGRGEAVPPKSVVRALVPVSVRAAEPGDVTAIGHRVASLIVELPTGEPSPAMRLHQIAYQTKAHREAGQAVDAPAIAGMAGFAPPTLHILGARLASSLSRRLFNLVVTNVPGPQVPLYLGPAQMLSTYPVIPLARQQALSVGLTSYDGGVFYGLYADRDAMADLDDLAQCLTDSLAELKDAAR